MMKETLACEIFASYGIAASYSEWTGWRLQQEHGPVRIAHREARGFYIATSSQWIGPEEAEEYARKLLIAAECIRKVCEVLNEKPLQ